jgi:hypothetical protein
MVRSAATRRIPVTGETMDRLRDFAAGLGSTYDEAIQVLLAVAKEPDEHEFVAGKRLRDRVPKRDE